MKRRDLDRPLWNKRKGKCVKRGSFPRWIFLADAIPYMYALPRPPVRCNLDFAQEGTNATAVKVHLDQSKRMLEMQ